MIPEEKILRCPGQARNENEKSSKNIFRWHSNFPYKKVKEYLLKGGIIWGALHSAFAKGLIHLGKNFSIRRIKKRFISTIKDFVIFKFLTKSIWVWAWKECILLQVKLKNIPAFIMRGHKFLLSRKKDHRSLHETEITRSSLMETLHLLYSGPPSMTINLYTHVWDIKYEKWSHIIPLILCKGI